MAKRVSKKRPGRPRKVRRDRRDSQLNVRLTSSEHQWVESRSDEKGQTMADYARARVLRGFDG